MANHDLAPRYDPKEVESAWYETWEKGGYFTAEPQDARADAHPAHGQVYCLTIPPPNVTGSLHMGHALQHSVHDCLIRWQRMRGRLTLCVPGTDHASIAVHTVLEKELAREGVSRHDLGREGFLERAWAWNDHYGGVILKQLRLLGCSYDWHRVRFTMDDRYYRAVQLVFVDWHRKGWVYRGYRIINWCPRCQTSLSDLEAPMVEQPGKLWHIRYPLIVNGVASADQGITVATTRPETMLGDTAVAVHPADERYRQLVGKHVLLPLMNREIPIIADEYVDSTFGTGAVKVTPAHDSSDFEMGQRHDLQQILVIGRDAHKTEEAGDYQGLERYECRERVIRDLERLGHLVEERDYPDARVPRCARCDTVLEPLPLEQWFVNMKPMADRAAEAITAGKVRYIPERYTEIALDWLRNIRDWNISRQLWWGQRIPAWQCVACEQWTVQLDPPQACSRCGASEMQQDPDVFDTWFSSGIWPQAVLGWPEATPELAKFFPTSLLITDRQILHLWVARMIMSSLDFLGQEPFSDVFVHPTILNWEGRRMSKSLGTGVDPLELIEEFGADATRFGLLYMCSIRQDVRFTEERIAMSRNFCNKIWNASRFVMMNLEVRSKVRSDARSEAECVRERVSSLSLPDRWIRSRYLRTVATVNEALTGYEFDVAARALYDFVWSEFCDWYVELSKAALREGGERQRQTQETLLIVLDGLLRLLHPFMPFLTEEIAARLGTTNGKPLIVSTYPDAGKDAGATFDESAESAMNQFCDAVRALRNLRAEAGVDTGKRVQATLVAHTADARAVLEEMQGQFASLDTRAEVAITPDPSVKPAQSLSATVGEVDVYLSLAGLVDVERERERLQKEVAQLRADLDRRNAKLADERFASRAPQHVVDAERARRDEAEEKLRRVEERLRETG